MRRASAAFPPYESDSEEESVYQGSGTKFSQNLHFFCSTLKSDFSELRRSCELIFGHEFGLDQYFEDLMWISENLTWILDFESGLSLPMIRFRSKIQIALSPASEGVERRNFISLQPWINILEILRGIREI